MNILDILKKFDVENASDKVIIQIDDRSYGMIKNDCDKFEVVQTVLVPEESETYEYKNRNFVRV